MCGYQVCISARMPYGITEAGRQWSKCFEDWLLHQTEFERVSEVSQLFILREKPTGLKLLAKLTEDLLIAGSITDINDFAITLRKRFEISKVIVDEDIIFNGAKSSQDP